MSRFFSIFLSHVVASIVLGICYASISAFFVKWFWNATMPDLFHTPTITAWQAWCLAALCAFLFKSSMTASTSNSK